MNVSRVRLFGRADSPGPAGPPARFGGAVKDFFQARDDPRPALGPSDLAWPDVTLAAAIVTLLIAAPWLGSDGAPDLGTVAMAVVIGLALIARRVWPVATLAVAVAAAVVWVVSDHSRLVVAIPIMVALFTVGDRCRPAVTALLTAAVVVTIYLTAANSQNVPAFDGENFQALGWFAAAAAAGLVVRERRVELAAVLDREASLRRQEARERVTAERLRIAQEIHDVVGHSVANVSMQAGVAARVVETNPDKARTALEAIAEVSRHALQEIRTTLGLLRSTDGDRKAPETAPTPTLADIDRLLSPLRARNVVVHIDHRGDPGSVPAVVGGALYRIAQEAVTNVLKHAHDATEVRVDLDVNGETVRLDIVNDGPPHPTGSIDVPPGHHGIEGMRERAAAVGGSLTVERPPVGGFAVRAVLPTGAPGQ